MDKLLVYLIVSIIGIPVIAFFVARFISSYKREVAMYDWSSAEVKRRGEAINQIEKKFKDSASAIAKLQSEVNRLTEEVEAYKKRFGNLDGSKSEAPKPDAGKAQAGKPGAPAAGMLKFDVGIFIKRCATMSPRTRRIRSSATTGPRSTISRSKRNRTPRRGRRWKSAIRKPRAL